MADLLSISASIYWKKFHFLHPVSYSVEVYMFIYVCMFIQPMIIVNITWEISSSTSASKQTVFDKREMARLARMNDDSLIQKVTKGVKFEIDFRHHYLSKLSSIILR